MKPYKVMYEIEYSTDKIFYDCKLVEPEKKDDFIKNILSQPGGRTINNGGRPICIDID